MHPEALRLHRLLRAHGLAPRHSQGQNFLIDPDLPRHIVNAAGVGVQDRVVEIGPGLGSLTRALLDKVGRVWCVERDVRLIPLLQQETRGLGALHIMAGDALHQDYQALADRLGGPLRVVANLPYQISSPLLLLFLEQRQAFHTLTLMLQKEVAQRLAASPGHKDYGTLSIYCQMWSDVRVVLEVPPDAFFPAPKVNSAVVHMVLRDQPAVPLSHPAALNQVVRAAFGQRRKTLNNALKGLSPDVPAWLVRAEIDGQRRGETLSLEEFARLAATQLS
ncbi:MAG: ribosomal RNA small subunit methyltransferase A [Magnetococcales bacterium]|nr:ribosomal RNA small subunit methyltransferase A [Magnetococcales bacterium]MBF0322665.1 ribosomal RNA small subunit methyltransferase A [Magnetococcales bacterium]